MTRSHSLGTPPPRLPYNADALFHRALNNGRWAAATRWIERGVSLTSCDPHPAHSRYFIHPLQSWASGVLRWGMRPEAQQTLDAFVARTEKFAELAEASGHNFLRDPVLQGCSRDEKRAAVALEALQALLRCPLPPACVSNDPLDMALRQLRPDNADPTLAVLEALAADREGAWFKAVRFKSTFLGNYEWALKELNQPESDDPRYPALVACFGRAFSIILSAGPHPILEEAMQERPELAQTMLQHAIPSACAHPRPRL